MSTRSIVTLALAVSALAASGCGGSSKTTSQTTASSVASQGETTQTQAVSTGPPLSNATLVAKADLICARINAVRASNVIKSPQELAAAVARLSAAEQRALEELSKLTPPSSLATTWTTMLTGYRAVAADLSKIKQAIAERKGTEVKPLMSAGTIALAHTTAVARTAGFNDCGKTA